MQGPLRLPAERLGELPPAAGDAVLADAGSYRPAVYCRVVGHRQANHDRLILVLGCGHEKLALTGWGIGTLTDCLECFQIRAEAEKAAAKEIPRMIRLEGGLNHGLEIEVPVFPGIYMADDSYVPGRMESSHFAVYVLKPKSQP